MLIEKTGQGKVAVYDVETGERLERWTVDARGMVEAGTHSYELPTRGKAGKAARAGTPEDRGDAGPLGDAPVFDPVKTPSMDPIMGAPDGAVDVQLGASTSVSVGIPPEGVEGAINTTASAPPAPAPESLASKVVPEGTDRGLPKTTPLGQPAVHSRAADAGPAKVDQAPVRTRAPGKGGR